ncbi:MAG: DNA-binding response regulator [Candidatus Kapaibacterium sp.]|nr:MAG: DNA-binding response regulator [Candidatus Kapabacteria bacterium]
MKAFRKLPSSKGENHLDKDDYVSLTQREQETLQYLNVGKTYQQIADTLGVSIETVRTHIKNSYTKLHVNNKHDAVRRFRQQARMW